MASPRPAPGGASPPVDAPLARLSSPVFAARVDELELLGRAVRHPPAVALVEGEAGVGKTRLVTELAAQVGSEGRRVLVGHCHPLHDPFPLGPLIEAIRSVGDELGSMPLTPLAGALRPVFPEVAARLPPAPEPLGDRHMERHRLWQALVEVLGALGPALVVMEDLHWADEATPQFLSFLAAHRPAELALVATARTGEGGAAALGGLWGRLGPATTTARVRLGPLAPADVRVMVGAILDTEVVSEEFAAYLHQRTAGVPLAVEEVLRLLVDRKDIVRWGGRWARRALEQVEVPAAIRDSMLERVAALGPDARRVLEAAAVVAEPAPEELLAAVAGLSPARAGAGLSQALAIGILTDHGHAYACRHALAAQAVYDALAAPTRRRLHQRAATALEAALVDRAVPSPDLPARLAHHWRHAGDTRRWVAWAEQAAASATALGDPGAAASLLLDAVSAPGLEGEERGRLALALAGAALNSRRQAEGIEAVTGVLDAEEEGLPVLVRAQLRGYLGTLSHQAGDASRAYVEYARAVPDLTGHPEALARVTLALALPWVVEGTLDDHLERLRMATDMVARLPDADARAVLDGDRAGVLITMGEPAAWGEIPVPPPPGSRLRLMEERARLCTNVAISAFYLGHDERAAGFVAEGLRISEDIGYPRMHPALHTAGLLLDWAGGRWDGLEADAQEILDGHPDVPSIVQVHMVLGQLSLARGQLDESSRHSAEVVVNAGRCGALPTLVLAAAALARLQVTRGEAEAARTQALGALEVIAAKGIWPWAAGIVAVAAEALVACGEAAEAASWCRRYATGIKGKDAPAARAAASAAKAVVAEAAGRPGDAAGHFARAAAAWARLGRPYDQALALEGRIRCLLSEGKAGGASDVAAAEQVGAEVLATFGRLGAVWDEARVRRLLRRHAVPVRSVRRRGRPGYGDQLSPREQEVVDLAAGGLTGTQIAQQLFLSRRTVEHSLERALRKLGMASRKELVAARRASEGIAE